ncbi:uncharacterized protein N7482_000418 [Penicillium canariense]|uniref:Uncharacterized protein n=1 Tax=Penicillium canariense TaxID=189055 RepID=A0A9W9IF97_9EURO|nr:uncharacterized protein N7482_000418 [Penicillium canariense]KAJ5174541.1 hypothetical protein N7482_000418 [Penicillium canariense]
MVQGTKYRVDLGDLNDRVMSSALGSTSGVNGLPTSQLPSQKADLHWWALDWRELLAIGPRLAAEGQLEKPGPREVPSGGAVA